MEQINGGILKLINFPENSRINASRNDFVGKRDNTVFELMLEKKNGEVGREVETKQDKKPADAEKDTDEIKNEQPVQSDKDEEESCDVAREAAAAQIVWLTGGNAQDLVIEKQENVATIDRPVIFASNDTPVENPEGVLEERIVQIGRTYEGSQIEGEIPMQENGEMPELAGETLQETMRPEFETELKVQEQTAPEIEIRVTENDGEEMGGESAAAETPLFREVETAPIKVAEAPERAEQSRPVEKQVEVKLADLLDSGEQRVEIQLEPLELGKLTVELTRNADGSLNILLSAENAQTRGLLERHIGSLQETLVERGQQSVQVTVDRGEESQRQDAQQRNDFQDGSNGRQSEQQRRRENQRSGEDFLQQLRLGLIPIEDEDDN